MPAPPIVTVTFYDNYHEVEVDVHFLGVTLVGAIDTTRTFTVHEVVEEDAGEIPGDPEHRHFFEVVEEKDYSEDLAVSYHRIMLNPQASGGTWSLTLHNWLGLPEPDTFTTGPLSYQPSAAEVRAAFPVEDLANDPGTLHLFRRSLRTGSGDIPQESSPGDPVFADFIDRTDLGPHVVEMRIYTGSGLLAPRSGASIQGHDIDLGPIWELQPRWDEIVYQLPLERNTNCA
jgi:hypothetical protein